MDNADLGGDGGVSVFQSGGVASVSAPEEILICPVCGGALVWGETQAYCSRGHTYDQAREGYVNLLLPNQKGSRDPGDSKEMARSRRAFLEGEFYAPLSQGIAKQIKSYLSEISERESVLVDAGCGEGYHLGHLSQSLRRGRFYGFDISKWSVRLAARRYDAVTWAVANVVRRIPVRDESVDVLVSIFAPRNPSEIHRILKRGGLALLVIPGPGHLLELCERLLDYVADQSPKKDATLADYHPHFQLIQEERVTVPLHLEQPMIRHLIAMTPLQWKSRKSALTQAQRLNALHVTASFTLLSLVRD